MPLEEVPPDKKVPLEGVVHLDKVLQDMVPLEEEVPLDMVHLDKVLQDVVPLEGVVHLGKVLPLD